MMFPLRISFSSLSKFFQPQHIPPPLCNVIMDWSIHSNRSSHGNDGETKWWWFYVCICSFLTNYEIYLQTNRIIVILSVYSYMSPAMSLNSYTHHGQSKWNQILKLSIKLISYLLTYKDGSLVFDFLYCTWLLNTASYYLTHPTFDTGQRVYETDS